MSSIANYNLDQSPEGVLVAAEGALALVNNAGVGELWLKVTGVGNTGWVQVGTGGGGGTEWLLAGNTLAGGEFLGSLNAFDTNIISNGAAGGVFGAGALVIADNQTGVTADVKIGDSFAGTTQNLSLGATANGNDQNMNIGTAFVGTNSQTISIGEYSAGNSQYFGIGSYLTSNQAVLNIGYGHSGTSSQDIIIGNDSSSGGGQVIAIGNTFTGPTQNIDIGVNVATATAQNMNIGTNYSGAGGQAIFIGTNIPTSSLQLNGGTIQLVTDTNADYWALTPGNSGDVLTSDGLGNTSWQPAGGGGGTALSAITDAVAINSIDSDNFAQTWDWSTLTTQTAMNLTADAITTGRLLLLESNGVFGNQLVGINATGLHTGQALRVSTSTNTGTGIAILPTALTSGFGLNITSTSAVQTGASLQVSSNSTGAASNGFVRFEATGDHTGNGVQINDNTTAGNVLSVSGINLTTGNLVDLNRSNSGKWIEFDDTTDVFGLYNRAGTPEASIAANIGSLSIDTTNGRAYVKTTDTVNTGWEQLQTKSSLVWAGNDSTGAGSTNYYGLSGSGNGTGTETDHQIATNAGIIRSLKVRVQSNGTSAASTVTLRVNGVASALAVTIPAGTSGVFTATTNVTVAANDLLSLQHVNGAGGAVIRTGMETIISYN